MSAPKAIQGKGLIHIQGTTSIAEKTVRPLMSATTVVSATAVVACSIKNV